MRLSVDSGTVVLSLENKNPAYMSAISGFFEGWLRGRLKMKEPTACIDENDYVITKWMWLGWVIESAEEHGIEIDNAVREQLAALERKFKKTEQSVKESPREPTKWEKLCKDGCGSCGHKRRCGDDFICAASGDILPEENKPEYYNGVYYLFNYVPYPSENCIYNEKT